MDEPALRYTALVRAPAGEARDRRWRDRFLAGIDSSVLRRQLDASGELRDGAAHFGRWAFVEPGALVDVPAPSPCPYVGHVVGGFTWEWWPGHVDLESRMYFADGVLTAARGCLVRDDGERFESIVLADFPLVDASQKHGFADGGFFLDHEPSYVAHVRDAITAALAELGLTAELITYGTGHNPHRFDGFVTRDPAAAWRRFDAASDRRLSLWGWALALPDHRAALAALLDPDRE